MKNLFAASFLILMLCVVLFAQSNQTVPCPMIGVTGPASVIAPDETMTFTATVSEDSKKFYPKYQWSVVGGEIVEGQGTLKITIKPTSQLELRVTAKIEVLNLPTNCLIKFASETASVSDWATEPILIDEFHSKTDAIDKVRLDNLLAESKNNPSAQIYIIEKFERKTSPKTIELKNQKTLDYLKTRGIKRDFITLLNAFGDENLTQFVLVPAGASPPTCDDCVTVQP